MDSRVQELVAQAGTALLPSARERTAGGATLAQGLAAALWPYLQAFAASVDTAAPPTAPEDRRARHWQVAVRFFTTSPDAAPDLVAAADPAVLPGTGKIPDVVATLAAQLHGMDTPSALSAAAVKERLPQLRNNLSRSKSGSALRIEYEADGVPYLCQVDVVRLGA